MQNFTFDAPTKPEEIQTPVQAEQVERNFDLLFRTFRKWAVLLRQMAINLTADVTGVLPVANGGTNSSTALNNQRFIVSEGGKLVEGALQTDTAGAVITFTSVATPATPSSSKGTLFGEAQAGHTHLSYLDSDGDVHRIMEHLMILVRNTSGSNMTKGQVVDINGSSGNIPTVQLADADVVSPTVRHAEGFMHDDVPNNAYGWMTINGLLSGLNTAAFSEGDAIYLSTTAGAYTATPPTPSATQFQQKVGIVTRSHASLGTIEVIIGSVLLSSVSQAKVLATIFQVTP